MDVYARVQEICAEEEIKLQDLWPPDRRREKACLRRLLCRALYNEGASMAEIAVLLHRDRGTVHHHIYGGVEID